MNIQGALLRKPSLAMPTTGKQSIKFGDLTPKEQARLAAAGFVVGEGSDAWAPVFRVIGMGRVARMLQDIADVVPPEVAHFSVGSLAIYIMYKAFSKGPGG